MNKKLLLILIFLLGWQICTHANPVEDKIRDTVVAEFSKLLGQPVSIAKLEGNLLKRAVFRDVSVGKQGHLDLVIIEYNLAKVLTNGGDFLSAVKSIQIDGARVVIDRDARGKWNWGFQEGDPGAAVPILNFALKVKGANVIFRDARGFGPQRLRQDFATNLQSTNVEIQFTPDGLAKIKAKGLAVQNHAQSPAYVSGFVSLDGKKFNLSTTLEKNLAIVDLAEYFLPITGMRFEGGSVGGTIQLANKSQAQQMPMDIQARLQISDGSVSLAGVDTPMRKLTGVVAIQNDWIGIQKFKGQWGSAGLTADGSIVAERFDLKIDAPNFNLNNLPKAFAVLKDQNLKGQAQLQILLKGKLNDPDFMTLHLNDLRLYNGKGFALVQWGGIGTKPVLEGQISLYQFNVPNTTGTASVQIKLKGPQETLQITVSADANQVIYQNQNLGQIQAEMILEPQRLKLTQLEIQNSETSHAVLTGDFDFKTQKFVLNVQPSQWKVNSINRFSGLIFAEGQLLGSFKPKARPEDFEWRGRVGLKQALVAGQWLENASFQGQWVSGNLAIEELAWDTEKSQIKIVGEINTREIKNLKILPGSYVALSDLDILSERYPELSGNLKLEGQLQGKLNQPQLDLQLELLDLQDPAEDLERIDRMTLAVVASANGVVLKNGLVRYQNEELSAQAVLLFQTSSANAMKVLPRSLSFETRTLDLERWNGLVLALQGLWQKWNKASVEALGPANTDVGFRFNLGDTFSGERTLHDSLSRNNSELYYFLSSIQSLQTSGNTREIHFLKNMKGSLSGRMQWQSRPQSPWEITGDLSFKNFRYGDLTVDSIQLLSEKKQQGLIASLEVENFAVSRNRFENIQAALELDDAQNLIIHHVFVKKPDESSEKIMSGVVPLAPLWTSSNAAVSLNIHIPGSMYGFLMQKTPGITRVEGSGGMDVAIAGPWASIKMSSRKLDFTGTKIYFDPAMGFTAPFVVAQQNLEFNESRIQVHNLEFDWQGEDTKNQPNRFKLSGSIGFEKVKWSELKEFPVDFDLQLQDGDFVFNLPSMLVATVKMRNMLLRGTYPFALSKRSQKNIEKKLKNFIPVGPTLNADITLEDGTILVATKGGPKTDKMLLEMQINLNIGVAMNVAVQGDLLGSDLSNLLTRYRFELNSGTSLNVYGNLNYPRIDGTVGLGAGYLAMLNRNFELASASRQREYYQGDLTKVKKNQVRFKPISSSDDSLVSSVYFSMTAETVIEGIATTINQKVTENLYLVVVEGPLSNLSSIGFEKYSSTDKKPNKKLGETFYLVNPDSGKKLEPERMSQLLTDLAPDFLRAMLLNQGKNVGNQNNQAQTLARDLTAEQLNVAFRQLIRPAERKLAKSVGLYDIQFQRDFSDVANQIFKEGTSGTTTSNVQKVNIVQVAFISELLKDRLYLTLNTRLDSSSSNSSDLYLRASSLKLTLSLFRQLVFNEILLSYQRGFKYSDTSQDQNTYLIEADHRF